MRQKTRILAAAVFLCMTGPDPAHASTLSITEQAKAFATCAGRLSALATRQRATHDPQAPETGRLGQDFEALLEATLPHARAAGISADAPRQWQIDGWLEIASLLRQRLYSPLPAQAARAEADMRRRIHTCQRLILAG